MASKSVNNQIPLHPPKKKSKMANANSGSAGAEMGSIYLPNLPDDVLEKIFSFLPIKLAAKSSVISKRFRNSWKLSRDLSFDVDFKRFLFHQGEIAEIVDRVLNQHSGSKIQKLGVVLDPASREDLVNDWIRKAVAKGVEELDLDFSAGGQAFLLTSDLIDVATIRVLNLSYCELKFAPELKGLRFLKTLVLDEVRVPTSLTDAIFGNCLLLEELELYRCTSNFHLEILARQSKNFVSLKVADFEDLISIFIDAPSLCSFYYSGEVCIIDFNCKCPHLDETVLNFAPTRGFQLLHGVEDLILALSFVCKLSLCSTVLEGLSPKFMDFEFREFQFCLSNLKECHLFLGGTRTGTGRKKGSTYLNPCDVAYFLQKCPHIETFYLDLGEYSFEHGLYWEMHAKDRFAQCNPSFRNLKHVALKGFKFLELELAMTMFFIRNAKFLEDFTIYKAKNCQPSLAELRFLTWAITGDHKVCVYDYRDERLKQWFKAL